MYILLVTWTGLHNSELSRRAYSIDRVKHEGFYLRTVINAQVAHWRQAASRRCPHNAVHLLPVLSGEADDNPPDDGQDKAAQEMGRKGGAARASAYDAGTARRDCPKGR